MAQWPPPKYAPVSKGLSEAIGFSFRVLDVDKRF